MTKIKILLYKETRAFTTPSVDLCLFTSDWLISVGWFLFISQEVKDPISKIFKIPALCYIHPNCPIFKLRTCLQAVVEYGNYKHSPLRD